jgi:hypothetical protein
MLDTLVAIVTHTPRSVWILLAALVALGVRQTAPRRIGARRALLLPAALLLLSLTGACRAFDAAGTLQPTLGWMLGAVLGAAIAAAIALPRGVVAHSDGSFEVPGSAVPLAILLALFSIHYATHAAIAIVPALATHDAFVLGSSLGYGLPSGMLAARAGKVWAARFEPGTTSAA